jgi:hypothetical protein
MIKITNIITYFFFTASVFACINFLYAFSENLDGEREGRGYNSRRLISSQLFSFTDTRLSRYLYP